MEIKYLTIALTLTSLIGLNGCDKDERDDPDLDITGRWLLKQSITTTADDPGTIYWEWSPEIARARIIEFTTSTWESYQNDLCGASWANTSGDSATITYRFVHSDTLLIENTQIENNRFELRYAYVLRANELVLTSTSVGVNNSGQHIFVTESTYERYTGSFPPSEWTTTIADDEYEPDDDSTQAKSISVGTTQIHTFSRHDNDWYSFSAVSGRSYTIETTGTMDTYLYLYDGSGAGRISSNDDYYLDEMNNWNARIDWTSDSSGTYLVHARAYNQNTNCGSYGFWVREGAGGSISAPQ
jgi:hypothetical protein